MLFSILAIGAGPVGGTTDGPGAGLSRASGVMRDRANLALAPIKVAKHRPLLLIGIMTVFLEWQTDSGRWRNWKIPSGK